MVWLDSWKKLAETPAEVDTRHVSDPVVQLRDVRKVYPGPNGGVSALRGIDLDVQAGEFLAIVGRSGAGKSTLLNMISGVDRLTDGEVYVNATPVHALDENQRALWRGRTLGIIYQSFELLPQLSLLDNVLLPMDLCGLYRGKRSIERALSLLEQVGLAAHAHKQPSEISGGQKQRVAIARALANDPPILIADEPTGNLDSATGEEIYGLFERLVAQGHTLIMVTHDRSAAARATRVLHLVDGEIVDERRN